MVKYEVILDPLAEFDIDEALDYYTPISKELAARFDKELEQKLEMLETNPRAFQLRYSRFRTIPLAIFPFMIHYFIDEENKKVQVLAIPHTSENPNEWPN